MILYKVYRIRYALYLDIKSSQGDGAPGECGLQHILLRLSEHGVVRVVERVAPLHVHREVLADILLSVYRIVI